MMASRPDTDRDADRIQHFLDKIEADRREAVDAVRTEFETERGRIRKAAFDASRRFFREQANAIRRQQQIEHDRLLSRARAELRRHNWSLLQELLDQAVWSLGQLMQERWRDPRAQTQWCLSWLNQALEHAREGVMLHIRLGEGAQPAARTALEDRLRDQPFEYRLSEDSRRKPGIAIEWEDFVLDGGLAAQQPRLETMVFDELTRWLHPHDPQTAQPSPAGPEHE